MSSTKSLLAFNALTLLGAYVLFNSRTVQQVDIWGPKPAALSTSNSSEYVCDPDYRVTPRFLSYDPIMVHIENFMTPYEVQYLRKLAEPHYEQSRLQKVASEEDNSAPLAELDDEEQRRSQTAWLPADPVTECVRRRAQEIEGFAPNASMNPLAAVRYGRHGDHLMTHYDHFQFAPQRLDRRTSFFAFLGASADLVGGATHFPFVHAVAWPQGKREWCARGILDCADGRAGVSVRPRVGSALFWVNFREDGTGHEGTAHSGEPILRGEKIGMNIWTIDQILE